MSLIHMLCCYPSTCSRSWCRWVRGALDRRCPHFSTIATPTGFIPKPVATRPSRPAPPAQPPSVLILPPPLPHYPPPPPPPHYPMPPSSQPGPSGPFKWHSLSTTRSIFSIPHPPLIHTGPIIHCLPPCPFRPSSVLQTSVGPGLLIPSVFYTPPPPCPHLCPPYPPLPNT